MQTEHDNVCALVYRKVNYLNDLPTCQCRCLNYDVEIGVAGALLLWQCHYCYWYCCHPGLCCCHHQPCSTLDSDVLLCWNFFAYVCKDVVMALMSCLFLFLFLAAHYTDDFPWNHNHESLYPMKMWVWYLTIYEIACMQATMCLDILRNAPVD